MTLNASAEKGSFSAGLRVSSASVLGSTPCTGGTSSGLGRTSTRAASSRWTALVFKATLPTVPHPPALLFLLAEQDLDRHRRRAEPVDHGLDGGEEVRTRAV